MAIEADAIFFREIDCYSRVKNLLNDQLDEKGKQAVRDVIYKLVQKAYADCEERMDYAVIRRMPVYTDRQIQMLQLKGGNA